jgi:hypothetical protein
MDKMEGWIKMDRDRGYYKLTGAEKALLMMNPQLLHGTLCNMRSCGLWLGWYG